MDRAAAASIALTNAARTLWSSSWRSAATVVPPGELDLLAQHRRVLAGLLEHRRGPEEGLDDELGGRGPGQPEDDAGLDHRLDDVEDVRRPAAGDRGDRVLVLLRRAGRPCRTTQQRLGLEEVLLGAVPSRRDRRHALVDEGRRVGHDPDHRRPLGQARLEELGRDAGRERDDRLPRGRGRGSRRAGPSMSCGLTTRTSMSADFGSLGVVSDAYAVLLGELAAWSASRSVMTRSAASRPERSRPDSRVSPITPAPKIAVVAIGSAPRRERRGGRT